jgi:hypothetical protein
MKLLDVKLTQIIPKYTPEQNPNKMTEERYRALVAIINEHGWNQPALVRTKGKSYELIDGHHRLLAATELNLSTMPCIVIDVGDAIATGLSIGMNNIRGAVNLTIVSDLIKQMEDLMEAEDVAVLSGFTLAEVEALVASTPEKQDLADMMSVSEPMDQEKVDKPFVLEVSFANRELYRSVRRKLKKAAGKGGDLSRGLLNVMGIDEEDLA